MPYEIQRLLPRHFNILKLTLAGYDRREISRITGASIWSITAISRSPLFQAELSRKKDKKENNDLELERNAAVGKARSVLSETRKILQAAAPEAATTLRNLLNGRGSDGIKIQSAKTVLDRVFASEDGPAAGRININITTEDTQLIVLALKESHASDIDNEIEHADRHPALSPPDGREDVLEDGEDAPGHAGPRGSNEVDPERLRRSEGAERVVT